MKRIALTIALLVGGTTVAHAEPPGLTPPAPTTPADPYGVDVDVNVNPGPGPGPGGWAGARGPMAQRGPRAERGARLGRHRLPPRLRARLVQMFDRDGDGRLQGPERRAARRFVRHLIMRRMHAQQQGPGARGFGGGR